MITIANLLRLSAVAFGAAFLVAAVGCTDNNPSEPAKARTVYGQPKSLGSGTARSFIRLDDAGKPAEVGLVMTEGALAGLPDSTSHAGHGHGPNMSIDLALPSEASMTPYDHIGVDWNGLGHPPAFYALPHFDFHFYTITKGVRSAMTGVGEDSLRMVKNPAPQYQPAGYISTGDGVPSMGMHWVDPSSPEFHDQIFTKTFIYGFYDGKLAFMEPMITRAFLLEKPNTTDSLKLPQAWERTGLYYASTYNVRWDAAKKEYIVSLGGMKLR